MGCMIQYHFYAPGVIKRVGAACGAKGNSPCFGDLKVPIDPQLGPPSIPLWYAQILWEGGWNDCIS